MTEQAIDTATKPEATPEVIPATTEEAKPPRAEARAAMHKAHAEERAAAEAEKPTDETPAVEKPEETPPADVTPEGETTEKTAEEKAAEDKTAEEKAAEEKAAEEKAAEDKTAEDKTAEEKKGDEIETVQVEIPAGHPIGGSGEKFITAADPQQERLIRGLLNGTYTRVQEVEAKDTEIAELQDWKARREANDAARAKWRERPEAKAQDEQYNEIKETVGEEAAERYRKGTEAEYEEMAKKEYADRMEAINAKNAEKASRAWAEATWQRMGHIPEYIRSLPAYSKWFTEALQSFDSELVLGHFPQLAAGDTEALHAEFKRYFGARLSGKREVTDAYRANHDAKGREEKTAATKAAEQERQRQKDRADAVEEHKREAAKNRKETPLHPLSGSPGGADRVSPESTDGGEKETADLTAHELRKRSKAEAREIARRYAAP